MAIIDRDASAFHRLSPEFTGERISGMGFDRDVLLRAGIERADAFAAVSSGDNSNIISARVAREMFGVHAGGGTDLRRQAGSGLRAARHPHHRHRAVDHRPAAEHPDPRNRDHRWRDPTGTVAVAEAAVHEGWVGKRATALEEATGARVAFLIRFGAGVLPEPKTVIQAGDQVYLAAVSGQCAEALAIAAQPPAEGVGE